MLILHQITMSVLKQFDGELESGLIEEKDRNRMQKAAHLSDSAAAVLVRIGSNSWLSLIG